MMNMSAVLVLLLLLLLTNHQVIDAYQKNHVSVVNDIAEGGSIKVHCYSGDDDMQYHMLAYKQQVEWSFHDSLFGNTKFICTITTKYGFGSYVAYKESMVRRCGYNCVWKVQKGGPCLQQLRDYPWCQPWQRKY